MTNEYNDEDYYDIPFRRMRDDEYYDETDEVVLVPVKVKYHYPTGIVFSFEPPTKEDIERCLRGR